MSELNLEFSLSQNKSVTDLGFPAGNRVGQIVLSVLDSGKSYVILDVEWNLDELVGWLKDNKSHMEKESLPKFVQWCGSIHRSIETTYENFDAYLDEQLDELFEYRRRHEICFGMRGVKIPAIYLGVGELGSEVSGERNGVPFCYAVGGKIAVRGRSPLFFTFT
ncbi:hypothetical protein [Cupriavidus sp. SW-Y-13]|uniref:hypothetical protein n=1 Tax=Cupriavidus sp. SW-Y-13 TaxID=2653854 RepID=UPI001366040E|nr:hypothetical protein [Cupriavidus sp. SW-Y-13]MWL91014.1 hypothetical protein [Cupriavidus sp. SW-Y-13]